MSAQGSPGRWTVIRDVATYLGGWVLLAKQAGIVFAPPGQTSETLIMVASVLIGGPGIIQLLAWRFGTGGSPSSPASPPSPSSPTPSISPPANPP